jgi:hypothetical protein
MTDNIADLYSLKCEKCDKRFNGSMSDTLCGITWHMILKHHDEVLNDDTTYQNIIRGNIQQGGRGKPFYAEHDAVGVYIDGRYRR